MMFRKNFMALGILVLVAGCAEPEQLAPSSFSPDTLIDHEHHDDCEDSFTAMAVCRKATAAQLSTVNQGNQKKTKFLQQCAQATGGSSWCSQLIRPNPNSLGTFRCTYGNSQAHQLINPNESTWKNAINTVKLIQELEQKGIRVLTIYNWWRPEPYNKNVGGSASRHPFGTSVDVRFVTNADADRAFNELCKIRPQGRIRAIGHYGTNALHFGVGDSRANTWGRTCP